MVQRPPALLLLALLPLFACGGEESAPKSQAPTDDAPVVEVVTVRPEPLRNVVRIPGQLAAELSVVLHPEIDGVVEEILFREGTTVTRGTLLIRLRDAEQRARLAEARARLALAEEVHRRTRELAARDVASEAQLERAAAERDVARARVELARVELERTLIRAPFDGMMGALEVSPGDRVEPETPLVRIDAIDRLQLLFYVPEVALSAVRPGIPVEIEVAPQPGRRFPGTVYFVSPTLDPATRRLLLKAWVPNPDHALRPGLFAHIDAEIGRKEDALLVPESALVPGLAGTSVWRIDGQGVAERVPVEVGLRVDGRAEILSGLEPGDRVVSAGTHKVVAGGRVRAVEATARAGPSERGDAGATARGRAAASPARGG